MIQEIFASEVFGEAQMRELPEAVYQSLTDTSKLGKPLDPEIAKLVAEAMKNWAISKGATHYSHWFQPLNNATAGKHDSFLDIGKDGKYEISFSPSALVRGEPDASSFPSGGLRATFEARGYTAWDPTSPAFVRGGTLYIPTAFCSYTGEALDSKTPLLRSMQALNPPALRILRALGNTTTQVVYPTVGAEQEYFLVDRKDYERRLDLKLCGRTIIGAKPPKGQELDDYYCGRIRLRVEAFMRDLDEQLWRLGIPSKTKHNEVAPASHELAVIFETANIACDHNLLTMEVMRQTAKRHGLACLLHEKPFQGVNGSGKHNNYSISTDDGINFLSPGKHPEENRLFLLTLCALLESVDKHADLLRIACATPGNDYRLGGCEAPPNIISVFLGEPLTNMLINIASGTSRKMQMQELLDTGVSILPQLVRDDSDRNRTSPFAFTGNKFEFRMLGSSQSIAFCNAVLNTAVADAFTRFADRLEVAENIDVEIAHIVADTVLEHSRIIFNGNNYADEWVKEAEKRGLPILNTSLEAISHLCDKKNIELFSRNGVLSEVECRARLDILREGFEKVVLIEAETLLHMVRGEVFPAGLSYLGELSEKVLSMANVGINNKAAKSHTSAVSELVDEIAVCCERLEELCTAFGNYDGEAAGEYLDKQISPAMSNMREACDRLEVIMPCERWPMPTYTDLLHRV